VIIERLELIGAVVTFVIFIFSILVFVFRLLGKMDWAKAMGIVVLLMSIPLVYLLITAPQAERGGLYYIQIGFMLLWMLVTLLVDYILHYNFRENIRMVIAYVVLFFAGTGGMLGVSALAGQPWITINGVLFLVMAVLAFVQRAKTGY
jgi:hypothetical protein